MLTLICIKPFVCMYTLHLPPSFAHTTLRASPHSYLHMVIHLHKPTSFACTHPPLLVLSHQQLSLSFACTALAHAQAPSFANNSFPGLTSLGIGSHHTHLQAGILLCLCTLISMHWPAFAREQLKTSQASHVHPSAAHPPALHHASFLCLLAGSRRFPARSSSPRAQSLILQSPGSGIFALKVT